MRVLRAIAVAISVLWVALWLSVSLTLPRIPGEGVIEVVASLLLGLVPPVAYLAWEYRRTVTRRREQRQRRRLASLPPAVREDWQRLEEARALAQRFTDDKWIERAALREVDGHVEQLRSLLEADSRMERLAGVSSTTLRTQVKDLTALLVALADSALEHQATLITDAPVPVTLAEARQRLTQRSAAYRSLRATGDGQGDG